MLVDPESRASSELERENPRPRRDVVRVDQFEGSGERNGRYAQQDERACLGRLHAILIRTATVSRIRAVPATH